MDAEQIVHDVAEKVRELITQAEERAAQIVRDAEDEATRIRALVFDPARPAVSLIARPLDDPAQRAEVLRYHEDALKFWEQKVVEANAP